MKNKISTLLSIIFITSIILISGQSKMVEAAIFSGHYDDVLTGANNLNNTINNSAKLGDVLLLPEVGWSRYDNSNSKIEYVSRDWKHENGFNSVMYKGNRSFIRSNETAKIKFSSYCKKIRILGLGGSRNEVYIDGQNVGYLLKNTGNSLLFEYEMSTLGNHIIEIVIDRHEKDKPDSFISLDAIDTSEKSVDSPQKFNPVLTVESPQPSKRYTGILPLSGYALNPSVVKEVKVYIDGNYSKNTQIGIKRDDVTAKYQGYPGAGTSGFSTTYNASDFTIGSHTIKVQAIGKDGTIQEVVLYLYVYNNTIIVQTTPIEDPAIEYQAHVQDLGWLPWVNSDAMAGTNGQARQMEAIKIRLRAPYSSDKNLHVQYRVHVQDLGWLPWVQDGEMAGTVGQTRRMEAIQMRIVDNNGVPRSDYELYYSAHVQNKGWLPEVPTNAIAGTVGEGLRMEALKVRAFKKS
ncbi:hypothetical protein H7E67_02145 [Clostridium gasigenes]|uniref:Ig-like domain-containing protein n=1 Tax=Clostridium gasigenes TaxID=94869 RepID=UPI00162A4F26|nr:Ig-like domain-containing protein [Clostridium gasigenes]MBB6622222.1 hypothetical protein [Clostridium gasigenes]